jgi:hypothetical protein
LVPELPLGEWVVGGEISKKTCMLGGRDQKGRGSKPTQANSSQDPISKILNTKKGLVE